MNALRRLFDFYLYASVHVALSVYCLVRISEFLLSLQRDPVMEGFAFCGTIAGYNFIKYDALLRSGAPVTRARMRLLMLVSFLASAGCVVSFVMLQRATQIFSVVLLAITVLYAVPFFPNRTNARSWAGLKIYMVALCWAGVTVILPALNAGYSDYMQVCILSVKRFILVVVLLFVFEIIDLAWDDPHLKTVPQQIGVLRTKYLGLALLVLFCAFSVFEKERGSLGISLLPAISTALMLAFAHERRHRYYTVFWTEAIPVFWWVVLCMFNQNQ